MTSPITRLTVTGLAVCALAMAACSDPDAGVEAGRSDRTRTDADPIATTPSDEPVATVSPTTLPTAEPAATEPPVTEAPSTEAPAVTEPPVVEAPDRPPAPPASGPGSVSADDLDSVFLPVNPDLLGPSSDLTDGRDPQTFLDEEMTFSGMDPVIEIAGAPITRVAISVELPVFDADGSVSEASQVRVSYRMAVEIANEEVDEFSEALREELRPIVEAANPGSSVTDSLGSAALGNPIFGLRVGPEEDPTTEVTIDQHYVIVPRLVNDVLLAVNVTRTVVGSDIVLDELPPRERFVDEALDEQVALFESVPDPVGPPFALRVSVARNLPAAGAATVGRSLEYLVPSPADGFEAYVDSFGAVVEADDYEGEGNFGNERSFDHVEERLENEFTLLRDDDFVVVTIRGDTTAYPN